MNYNETSMSTRDRVVLSVGSDPYPSTRPTRHAVVYKYVKRSVYPMFPAQLPL
ncbi:hypothetical protein NEUTE2DRAFT_145702 [Neurospora tetrasperma FGSC 2509]|nr:hypothetical protein NEUTE2DRAFT_145702 [Neurospora tetrasperma FGSC 2509]